VRFGEIEFMARTTRSMGFVGPCARAESTTAPRRCGLGGGGHFYDESYALAADRAGWDLELLDPSRSPLWSAATIDSTLVDHCQGTVG
jgi:hypothetical protein